MMNTIKKILNLIIISLVITGTSLITSSLKNNSSHIVEQSSIVKPDQNTLLNEIINKQASIINLKSAPSKLKIGIIDVGAVEWLDLPPVKANEMLLTLNPDRQKHGNFVVREIVKALEATQNLSKVEIIYCEVSLNNMYLEPCLEFMLKEKINILNLSMEFKTGVVLNELYLLNQLSITSKIVIAAGNTGKESENLLCNLNNNKICVGGYNTNGEIDYHSNYGKNVDIYESYQAHYSNYTGTSFSAPIHVGKIANLLLSGHDYQYATQIKNNSRTMASSK